MVLHQVKESADQLIILHRQHTVNILLGIRKDLLTHPFYRRAVCDRVGAVKGHRLPGSQSHGHTGRLGRLHADYLDLGIQHLGKSRNSGDQTAAAYRRQNIIHGRQFLYNLHGNRPLPGSNIRVIKGMDKGIALLLG